VTSSRLGLDRDLKLTWLDEAAVIAGRNLNGVQLQSALMGALAGELPGAGHNSARGKTVTVLKRVWVTVPNDVTPLRDRALGLLQDGDTDDRLALHWAMLLATYPFFADVVGNVGRLLALQGTFERSHVLRRLKDKWGDRPTIPKAVRRVLTSLVGWQVLQNAGSEFSRKRAPRRISAEHASVLLEAAVLASPDQTASMQSLATSPLLFAFDVGPGMEQVRRSGRLSVHREGMDLEIVSVRP
jgi:hypothetical protein